MEPKSIVSEDEWITRFRHGDRAAFEFLYRLYAENLITYASRKLSSLEEARDIIHDLFVELWTSREKLAVTHSLQSYLFSATRYRIIDHIRKNSRKAFYARLIHSVKAEEDESTAKEIVYKDLHHIAEEEIDKLSPRAREIFRLSRHQHMSITEIAEKLELSDQTVKNQLTTANKKLRFSLQKILSVFL